MYPDDTKENVEHPCRYCQKEIPHWRTNKVYCDEICKNNFFNQLRKEADIELGRVNKILKKNFDILKKLIKDERNVKVTRTDLEKKGFNFNFLTHQVGEFRNCYLLAWKPLERDNIMITRTPERTIRQEES